MEKTLCCNCNGDGSTSTNYNCPECKGNGVDEIIELRKLNNYMKKNVASRSRPPKALVEILNRIARSQNKSQMEF